MFSLREGIRSIGSYYRKTSLLIIFAKKILFFTFFWKSCEPKDLSSLTEIVSSSQNLTDLKKVVESTDLDVQIQDLLSELKSLR
jgi:hypothetical protein